MMNYIIPNKGNYRQYKYNKRYHIYKFIWITYGKIFEEEVRMPISQLIVVKTKIFIILMWNYLLFYILKIC